MGEIVDKAVRNVGLVNSLVVEDNELTVAMLVREEDWRPLRAKWWRGKEACIIGADINGNFFLRHCDGSVRYWDHKAASDKTIAPSVREFIQSLRPPSSAGMAN